MEGRQQQIKKAMEQLGEKLAEGSPMEGMLEGISVPEGLKKAAEEVTQKAASAKQAMGMTDAMIESIYGQAYRLYNTGKYKESAQLFRLLIMLDPKDPRYLLGIAASYHMLKEFKNAVSMYAVCAMADPDSPIPHYHVSDCYLQMKDKVSAIISLEMAVNRAKDLPAYQTLKDRALLTIENLKKELVPKKL